MTPSKKLKNVSAEVVRQFSTIEPDKLLKQPAAYSWSAGQCLIHLIRTNEAYLPAIERALSPAYSSTFWERISPFSKRTGSSMIQLLGPQISKRYRTPKAFDPKVGRTTKDPVAAFLEHQEVLIPKVEALSKPEFAVRIVSSPVSSLITFPAGDLAAMLAAHEERHLKQAIAAIHALLDKA